MNMLCGVVQKHDEEVALLRSQIAMLNRKRKSDDLAEEVRYPYAR